MTQTLDTFLAGLSGTGGELALLAGVALGSFLLVIGVGSALSAPNPAAVRLAASDRRRQARLDQGLLKPIETDPTGLMKSFVPSDEAARSRLRRKLEQAGQGGANAVARFTLKRILLGILLPAAFLGATALARSNPEMVPLGPRLASMSSLAMFQTLTILLAIGYFGPLRALNAKVADRRRRIEEGFPNALDLMRISVESGLGFDAAMTRVGNELATVSPDIAYEFLAVQHEVQAGRARDVALTDMAERVGLDFVYSFVNVVRQSMQFGTSMTEALAVYAEELRNYREMRAQEKANKLPVKMSAVLASLMLPALVLLSLGPVIIRYTNYFAQ
jgi:tight adherence protein C